MAAGVERGGLAPASKHRRLLEALEATLVAVRELLDDEHDASSPPAALPVVEATAPVLAAAASPTPAPEPRATPVLGILRKALEAPLDEFKAECRARRLSEGTITGYGVDLARYVAWLRTRGVVDWNGVTERLAESYIVHLTDDRNLGARTVRHSLSAIRCLHKFMLRRRDVTHDPTMQIRPPRTAKRLPRVLTVEELSRLLETCSGSSPLAIRDRAMVELCYAAGLRGGELCGITLDKLDLDAGTARVIGKGDRERVAHFGEHATRALRAWLERGRPAMVKASRHRSAAAKHAALFVNYRGNPISRYGWWNVIERRAKEAGLKHVHPHTLRHTFATHLLNGGANIREVQELLGHADISSTMIYTTVDQTQLRHAYKKAHPRS